MPILPDWETLSLAEQVAQMLVVRASGFLFDHQIQYPQWEPPAATLRHWIQDLGVGGVILLGGSAAELKVRSHQLQGWASVPLLLCADIEEGVGQRFSGATWFPPPLALGAIAQHDLALAATLAEQMGAITAQEAQAIGINWVLAPVVDVNNNPQNPVINVRAFGETPEIVSHLTTAFLRGVASQSALATAKHFPGHGDTATDSHLDLPVLPHTSERLAQVEYPPFQAAIAAGVDAVMSAHLLIPALDATYPATLSYQILTDILRKAMGFDGLIVTDALIMGAIAQHYGVNEAPVLAIEAGADILMMPIDPAGAIAAICDAVAAGRITPERIQASVERIGRAKQKVCLPPLQGDSSHAWENLPLTEEPTALIAHLAQPTAIALNQRILTESTQVVCPTPSRLSHPRWSTNCRNLIVVDDALSRDFLAHHTPAIAIPRSKGYQLQVSDRHTPPTCLPPDATHLQETDWRPTLLQLFIRGNPFRGSAGFTQIAQDWVHFLLVSDQLQAIVFYGSPYLLPQFLPLLSPDVPYAFTYGQTPEAQAIALSKLGVA